MDHPTHIAAEQRPLATSCRGGSPAARLAAEVVEGLERIGVADATGDVDRALEEARGGRRLVAIDGCASACCSRLLEARGARTAVELGLEDLGVNERTLGDVDRAQVLSGAATRLRVVPAAPPSRGRRTRVSSSPSWPRKRRRAYRVEDYLLAIDTLSSPVAACGALVPHVPTLSAHVASVLGISRATAGEMLARLDEAGLVARSARKEILLTPRGRLAADRAVWRHRLLECFATDFLGYRPAESYERARDLDAAFDDEMVERVCQSLGTPARCPHGWPVDPIAEREEGRELVALSSLQPGGEATLVRVVEQDTALLDRFAELALTPGATLALAREQPRADSRAVWVDGATHALDLAAVGGLLVRPRR